MMQLRPYQQESIDSLFNFWSGGGGDGLVVLPTGSGKSLVLASTCKELLTQWPDMRVGVVTHVKELVQQNTQETIRLWPQAPIGIYSASIGRRDTQAKMMFMGIHSVHRKSSLLGKFDVLLVDEAHLIPQNADTMYGRFISRCRDAVPDMRMVGLTATPYRLDSGRLRYSTDLQNYLDNAKKEVRLSPDQNRAQAIYNEMVRRHDFTMNPTAETWSQIATSASFLWTMGWNISSGVIVLHDPIQRGIPNLGYDAETGNVGLRKSAAEIARAAGDLLRGKGFVEGSSKLTGDERNALQAAHELNVIEGTRAHDLAGVADFGVGYSPVWHKVMETASAPLHHGERINREVTFLAAYRIARKAGFDHAKAVKKAADLTWMGQFSSQANDKPRVMQGPVGRAALALRNFHANIISRAVKDFHEALVASNVEPEARKAAMGRLVSSMMITAAMAGVRGAYFSKLIIPIAGAALGALGLFDNKHDDAEEALRRHVLNAAGDTPLGHALGGIFMDGLPGYLTGINLSDRIGVADLGFRPPERELSAEQEWNYWLQQAGGPALEIFHNALTGAGDMWGGNYMRGLQEMLPAAGRNIVKAYRYGTEGVTNRRGDSIVENVAPQDIAKQALGFGPAEIADRYARNTYQNNVQKKIGDERAQIMTKAARARLDGDDEAYADALKEVEQFNQQFPGDAIKGRSILQSVKSRARYSGKSENGVVLKDGLAEPIKSKTARSIYSRE